MKIIIQKFGGTSVATVENRERVSQKIINKYNSGYGVVVVVSAIGRKGDPYATDTLLSLVDRNTLNKRELDILMSCGEVISAVVLCNLLNKKGYDAVVLNGAQAGIRTNKVFGNAEVLNVTSNNITTYLKERKIVIVTGFQGVTEDGEITTLGRGGSDTTAVVLGEALGCEYVEIYTDVDGIMTADPRIVPEAKVIDKMCYSEVFQLAENGAKVIHPKAVEIAERSNIKVIIKNTLKDCQGTLITNNEDSNYYQRKKRTYNDNIINAITYKDKRVQVIVNVSDKQATEKLMEEITNANISLDLINFFIDKKIFTIDEDDLQSLESILDSGNYNYNVVNKCTKLCVIGHRMRGIPGVMARIVNALSKENIEILQSSDSHTTIWCLVKSEDADKAVRILHKEFDMDKK
ncbi:aspartate kinase [Thermohalobacter berrensis]|uniref:Aspartokinase n=1 Tax=Thermohalobacter berrensis TaxID=99594 RepID=A0A419TAH7_9FIRM|nr:aspartate kinase [Thermohalobacter berrensis]RKD34489.1 aspartate kinase [Thermohalobacter berrensis]